MKNLVLPNRSSEEIREVFNNVKPNDKLVKVSYLSWGDEYSFKIVTVVKRTPKGSIRLDNGELLKYMPSNYYLLDEQIEKFMELTLLEKEVMSLLFDIDRSRTEFKKILDEDTALKLKDLLGDMVETIKSNKKLHI